MSRRSVYLVGFMMAGKSEAGRLAARDLGRPFVDLDERVAAQARSSVPALFRDHGEARFRDLESEALRAVAGEAVVIATGGGAVERAGNRSLMLATGLVLWLSAPFAVIWSRGEGESAIRPLWRDEKSLETLFERRTLLYAFAHRSIDTSDLDPNEVAREIASIVREWEPCR